MRESDMITGNGMLLLRNGRSLPVGYQFASEYDDARVGYLLCDTTELDPGLLCSRLQLVCDDGAVVVLTVMHSNDHHLGVIGRVVPPADQAA
jgi:hypothetical protein